MQTEYNVFTVLNSLVLIIGPVLTTIVTYILTAKRSVRLEVKADTAVQNAEVAASRSLDNSNKLEEVHKTVNGRNEKLLSENEKLKKALEKAEAVIGRRRKTDKR